MHKRFEEVSELKKKLALNEKEMRDVSQLEQKLVEKRAKLKKKLNKAYEKMAASRHLRVGDYVRAEVESGRVWYGEVVETKYLTNAYLKTIGKVSKACKAVRVLTTGGHSAPGHVAYLHVSYMTKLTTPEEKFIVDVKRAV